MHHAVTIKWVVSLYRLEKRVLGIAKIYTVEVLRYFANDLHIPSVVFAVLGAPDT